MRGALGALWQIARFEFLRVVKQRRFLFFALGMPIFFVVLASFPIFIELFQADPVAGYVDQSGLLADSVAPEEAPDVIFRSFDDEATGRAALEAGEIESLWIVPADYLQSGRVRSIAEGEASGRQRSALGDLMRANLLRDLSPEVSARIQNPMRLSFFSLNTGRRVRVGTELLFALLIPIGVGVAFALSISFSAGFLAQAMAEEKENRLIEILVTSTRVWSLLGGKVLGLGAVALTQVIFWGSGLLLAAFLFYLRGEFPSGLPIPWDILGWALLFAALAYALYATLMVGIGVLVGEAREAQQISGILGILAIIPVWFTAPIIEDLAGTVARFFTLFPFTAPTLIPVRMALGRITPLEVGASLLILLSSVITMLWLVAALYRAAMLRYGTRLSINEMLAAVMRR